MAKDDKAGEDKPAEKVEESKPPVESQGKKVTFEDYEKLMQRLEKEQNFDEIRRQNPRAMEA